MYWVTRVTRAFCVTIMSSTYLGQSNPSSFSAKEATCTKLDGASALFSWKNPEIHLCIHSFIHMCVHACVRARLYVHTYIRTRMYVHTYNTIQQSIHKIHACTHAYTHTYIHMHIPVCILCPHVLLLFHESYNTTLHFHDLFTYIILQL